jgi:parvulin-like peptidyl-prolyl isomerase
MLNKICLLGIIVLALWGNFCADKPSSDTLLKIGSDYLTTEKFYQFLPKNRFDLLSDKNKTNQVIQFAKEQLMLKDAVRLGFPKRKEITDQTYIYNQEQLVTDYLNKTILDSLISEDYLHHVYEQMGVEIKASHVLISFHPDAPEPITEEAAYKKALVVYDLAVAGTPFEELAQKYSDDPGSKSTGDLGYFSFGRMVPQFQEAAYALKIGEISKPVRTQYGFHIIKVFDRRPKQTKSYSELKEYIKDQAMRTRIQELRNAYAQLVKNLRQKHGVTLHLDAINAFCTQYGQQKTKLQESPDQFIAPLEILATFKVEEPLLSYDNKVFAQDWFVDRLNDKPERIPPNMDDPTVVSDILESMASNDILMALAVSSGFAKDKDFVLRSQAFANRLILEAYRKEMIENQIILNEDSLKAYYEHHKFEKYMGEDLAEVQEIYMTDSSKAAQVLHLALGGANFDTMATRYTERFKENERPGYLGLISAKQYGGIGKTAHTNACNTIHEGLVKSGKGYSIIKVFEKEAAKPKDLESIKTQVSRDYSRLAESRLDTELFEKLKDQYKLKIYWSSLDIIQKDTN